MWDNMPIRKCMLLPDTDKNSYDSQSLPLRQRLYVVSDKVDFKRLLRIPDKLNIIM